MASKFQHLFPRVHFASSCKGTYACVRPHRYTYGNYRNTVANVDASDSRCRCIGKIIARDLRLVASRLYTMAVTRPGSRAAVTPVLIIVVIAGDPLRAPICLWTQLRCRQVAQLDDGMINALCFAGMMLRYRVWRVAFSIVYFVMSRVGKRGKVAKSRERNVSVYWKSDNSVRARTPAFGLIGIRMVIIGIRLQTWMRVIVGLDV